MVRIRIISGKSAALAVSVSVALVGGAAFSTQANDRNQLSYPGQASKVPDQRIQRQIDLGNGYLETVGKNSDKLHHAIATKDSGGDRQLSARAPLQRQIEELKSQWLVASGFEHADVAKLDAAGLDFSGAVRRGIAGSILDYAITSEIVLVGMVESSVNEDLRDGALSTIRFKVEEVLKGDLQDDYVNLRQRSGVRSDGMGVTYDTDIPAETGARYLLFVSSGLYDIGMYQFSAQRNPHPGAYYLNQRSPFKITEQGAMRPVAHGVPVPDGSLEKVSEQIAAIDSIAKEN